MTEPSAAFPEPTTILTRDADDTIMIGPALLAPAGVALVALPGATLVVDPMDPSRRWQVRVTGTTAGAQPLVAALVGDEAAQALPGADEHGVQVPVAHSVERDELALRAVLGWLDAMSPLPLDPRLLALQALVLETEHADLLALEEATEDRYADWLPTLLQWARRSHPADSILGRVPTLLSLLSEALHAALALLESGPQAVVSETRRAQLAQARHEAELLGQRERLGLTHLDADAALAALTSLRPHPAMALGPGPQRQTKGVSPLDWARVPRGVLATGEEAISWQVSLEPTPQLTVVVAASASDPSCAALDTAGHPASGTPPLQATLVHPDWPIPLAVVELVPRAEAAAWLGSGLLGPQAVERILQLGADTLVVDVHVAGHARRPRLGADGWLAAATRWAARGLSGVRLAAAYPAQQRADLQASAAGAFTTASRLFRAAGTRWEASAWSCELAAGQLTGAEGERDGARIWRPTGIPDGVREPVLDLTPRVSVAESWYAAHLRPTP